MFTAFELWNRYRPHTRTMLIAAAITTIVIMAANPNFMRTNMSSDWAAPETPFRQQARNEALQFFAIPARSSGIVGGVPGGIAASNIASLNVSVRQVVKTATLNLVTLRPDEDVDRIRAIAQQMHGYVVSSEIQGYRQTGSASVTLRVPTDRMDEARAQIRKLAFSTELDRTDTNDVTKQYVDMAARLKNYRAEEAQYLIILKQARTVKDTLSVSEHLSEVRQQIEQLQGEFNYLAHQVEMASITVELRSQEQAQVLGIRWRPLYQSKLAVIDGLDALADYATNMLALLMRLPAILLWIGTVMFLAALGWRLLKWLVALLLPVAKTSSLPANLA